MKLYRHTIQLHTQCALAALVLLIACSSVLVGCSTANRSTPRYAWETAQEQTYTAPFRGRWWNYYDRGLWNQLRGNYEEALADIEYARTLRADDQLWPRTYGMHFLPEYFPNREMGITFFHMGHHAEATRALQESLNFQYSARAAYYLDEARRATLSAENSDLAPPDFQLIAPALGAPVGEMYTVLQGVATDDQFVSKVLVNGTPVDIRHSNPEIPVLHPITLHAGQNAIEVEIIDLAGRSTRKRFEFETDHEGPVLSFDDYVASRGVIRGVAYDPAGIDSFEINGAPVSLPAAQDGLRNFEIPAAAQSEVTYRCVDAFGNVTEGTTRTGRILQALGVEVDSRVRIASRTSEPAVVRRYLAQQTDGIARFNAELVNIQDEQRFYLDRITVNMEVISPEPIEHVTFNGRDISLIPARKYLRLSQSVGLGDEPASMDLILAARNVQGDETTDEKKILRELSAVDTDEGRLSLAFVELTNAHPTLNETQAELTIKELQETRTFSKRFGQPVVRDEDALARILQEQKLAQLSSDEHRLLGGQIVTADIFVGARLSGTEDFVQIILEGYSSRVNRVVTDRVEVAGAFEDLPVLLDTLATRLVQEFPRLQASAIDIQGEDVAFTLTAANGIKENFNCILVERARVVRGPFESVEFIPRGAGLITNVRQQDYSEAQITLPPDFDGTVELGPNYDTFFVITK